MAVRPCLGPLGNDVTTRRLVPWGSAILAAGVLLLGLVAPIARGQQGSALELTIDSPAPGTVVAPGQSVTIGGWAVDPGSSLGPGVDQVQFSVDTPPWATNRRVT